jgi:hypothetical protein
VQTIRELINEPPDRLPATFVITTLYCLLLGFELAILQQRETMKRHKRRSRKDIVLTA